MTVLQTEILHALEALGERSRFTDAILAKKLRERCRIDGKKKSVLALTDILVAMESLAQSEHPRYYDITVTSANDLLMERCDEPRELPLDAKQRRQRHEKSQTIFTNADIAHHEGGAGSQRSQRSQKSSRTKGANRTQRTSINIYSNYEDDDADT